jgi:hypothetical protein
LKETRHSNSKLEGDFLFCAGLVNIHFSSEHRFFSQEKTGGDKSTGEYKFEVAANCHLKYLPLLQ